MATAGAVATAVTGCLEAGGALGDTNDAGRTTDMTDTDTNDPEDGDGTDGGTETDSGCPDDQETGEQPSVCGTQFEVTNETAGLQESADVTVEDGVVSVTGVISGNNGCYTARLDDAVIEDAVLVLRVESFDDSTEGEFCSQEMVSIEYRATIETAGDRPEAVRVEHNGEPVTTEQAP